MAPHRARRHGRCCARARGRSDYAAQVSSSPVITTLPSLAAASPLLTTLAEVFAAAGHQIALVGGPVRDALLGKTTATDWDFTTSARPEQILQIVSPVAQATWDVGIRFGTIGARIDGAECEITTWRAEHYDPDSRKPDVDFGDSLAGDLMRRDFTVNAMAVDLASGTLVDLFHGRADLADRILRTPALAHQSFSDDPLRMMRAARFASQLHFAVAADVAQAMIDDAPRITIVSAERVRDELVKIIMSEDPRTGLTLLVDTGLAAHVLPELPLLRLEADEHHHHKDVYEHTLTVLEQAMVLEQMHEPISGPDQVLRLAALLHDIGKPRTRRFEEGGRVSFHHHEVVGARMTKKRMQALRFSNDVIDQVSQLVELHLRFHGYGAGQWTDSAVRRYVRDAGELLPRLHKLTRADCTTRNRKRAAALQRAYDSLETRIAELAEAEELASIRPDLDGAQIMQILDIAPGPLVGQAYRFLMDLRLDHGPMDTEQATQALMSWWAAHPNR